MNNSELRGANTGGEGSKKLAAVSMDGERPSKAARTDAPSDTRRLENIPVLRLQGIGNEEVEMEQLVKVREVRDGVVIPLLCENLDVIANVRQGSMFLNGRRLRSLPSHG